MTDTNDIVSSFNDEFDILQQQIREAQDKAKKLIKSVLPAVGKDFFARHPEIYGFGWVQYAPYFNDGDACEFSAHEVQLYLTEESHDDNGWYDGDHTSLDRGSTVRSDFEKIKDLIEGIDDDYLEDLYGGDAAVLFTKDGIEIGRHRHD